MTSFTVISFYTPDWKYPEYAKNLADDCTRLGLEFAIEPRDSTDSYVGNCNLKPNFIRDKLQELKRPVLWMDVDGIINLCPEIFFSDKIHNFDIAANRSQKDSTRIHVGSIWFNYTATTVELVNAWCESVANRGIDDSVFNGLWTQFSQKIKLYELPDEYFYILPRIDSAVPDNICIAHRLSNSPLKQTYKNNIRKST